MRLKSLASTVTTVLFVFAVRSALAEPFVIPSGSMRPSIVEGDHILVNKMAYDFKIPFTDASLFTVHEPERGDVVVFRYPKDRSQDFIKRLIGLPGDRITVKDGVVTVNGVSALPSNIDIEPTVLSGGTYAEALQGKSYVVQRLAHTPKTVTQNFFVPNDMYFFMGDNRDDSLDSRFWGFVPRRDLKGKALFVIYSFHRFDDFTLGRFQRTGIVF